MKKELYNGIEYHFPDTFPDAKSYLSSLEEPIMDEQIVNQLKWDDIRLQRNIKIKETDWTQMPDAPLDDVTKAKFTDYRQALRDIPQNNSDPDDVVWPSQPTA
ncbi:TPA: phage tail assembly chaperone [Vibrio vulnificus]|nr:phage tail assembly chaperone [Vibrio vulnificus]